MREFALPIPQTIQLIEEFRRRGVTVFSTPLDLVCAESLTKVSNLIKISSGDLNFTQLLDLVGESGADVILSTGMAHLAEVAEAIATLRSHWGTMDKLPEMAVLHCVSMYPADQKTINLSAIRTLWREFPEVHVGYSDHTIGVDVAARSVAAGARIVEKHFTLDKNFSGFRDHALSADPKDLALLRSLIDEIDEQMGDGNKGPIQDELSGREAFRRSLTIRNRMHAGQVLSREDVLCQRPGTGFPPSELKLVVGRRLSRSIEAGHILTSDDIEAR